MISDKQQDTYPATATPWQHQGSAERSADEHPARTPGEAQPRHAPPRPQARDARELLARLESLAAKVGALEPENVRLRAEMGALRCAETTARETPSGESSRRSFLRRGTMLAVAGLGAGVAAGRVGVPGAEAAAAPPPVLLGQTNTAGATTTISTSGVTAMQAVGGGSTGTGLVGLGGGAGLPSGGSGSGVIGASAAGGPAAGVSGYGNDGTPGVSGSSDSGTGVFGNSEIGVGVSGVSAMGTGVSGSGGNYLSGTAGTGVAGTGGKGGTGGSGVTGTGGSGASGSANGIGVYGTGGSSGSTTPGSGVVGTAGGMLSTTAVQVGYGVAGLSEAGADYAAVCGQGTSGTPGVVGTSDTESGISGYSVQGWGVVGTSLMAGVVGMSPGLGEHAQRLVGNGVLGLSDNGLTRAGVAGYGVRATAGVSGGSDIGTGVIGTAGTSGYGVQGTSAAGANSAGVYGNGTSGTLGVQGRSDTGTGVSGLGGAIGVAGQGDTGVHGASDSGPGVLGSSGAIGVFGAVPAMPSNWQPYIGCGVAGYSEHSSGVLGASDSGYGGSFQCGTGGAQLFLAPAGTSGAPTSGTHQAGELFVDSKYALYFCSADGTPGTWNVVTLVPVSA